jgi:hypothetical protein
MGHTRKTTRSKIHAHPHQPRIALVQKPVTAGTEVPDGLRYGRSIEAAFDYLGWGDRGVRSRRHTAVSATATMAEASDRSRGSAALIGPLRSGHSAIFGRELLSSEAAVEARTERSLWRGKKHFWIFCCQALLQLLKYHWFENDSRQFDMSEFTTAMESASTCCCLAGCSGPSIVLGRLWGDVSSHTITSPTKSHFLASKKRSMVVIPLNRIFRHSASHRSSTCSHITCFGAPLITDRKAFITRIISVRKMRQ